MTSENPSNGPPGDRSERGNRSRRIDQGDLWTQDPVEEQAPPPVTRPARRSQPVAQRQAAVTPAPPPSYRQEPAPYVPPTPEYDDDDDGYYADEEPSLLGNPYVLAAVAVLGAIVLAVIVVFLFGGNDNGGSQGTTANATRTPTTPAGATGPSASGLRARSIAIATVREGPALTFLELGTLPADQDVDVVGRNEESTWFQIIFPPGTELRGWVPETALRLPDNVNAVVPVAEASPVARPEVPEPTPTFPPEPEESPTPSTPQGPDLAVSIASNCEAGSDMVIAISNEGTEDLEDALIEVIVANNSIVQYQQPFQARVPVGGGAQLNTGVPAQAPQMSVVVRLQELDDVNPSNNGASCEVQAAAPNNGGGNVPPAIATQLAGQ